jgi:hypothetical protein
MFHCKAIVCSRIGGLPEIGEEGITGLFFVPLTCLLVMFCPSDPNIISGPVFGGQVSAKMGKAGRKKALREYSQGLYNERLMACYKKSDCHSVPGFEGTCQLRRRRMRAGELERLSAGALERRFSVITRRKEIIR